MSTFGHVLLSLLAVIVPLCVAWWLVATQLDHRSHPSKTRKRPR